MGMASPPLHSRHRSASPPREWPHAPGASDGQTRNNCRRGLAIARRVPLHPFKMGTIRTARALETHLLEPVADVRRGRHWRGPSRLHGADARRGCARTCSGDAACCVAACCTDVDHRHAVANVLQHGDVVAAQPCQWYAVTWSAGAKVARAQPTHTGIAVRAGTRGCPTDVKRRSGLHPISPCHLVHTQGAVMCTVR